MFYYNNLTAIEPQSQDSDDLQLGLTRMYTVRARVDNVLDAPSNSPINNYKSNCKINSLHSVVVEPLK